MNVIRFFDSAEKAADLHSVPQIPFAAQDIPFLLQGF